MTIDRRKALTHLALLPIAAAPVAWAQPADYPNRPVRVVVAFTAGGTTDILARAVGQRLTERFKQNFVIDNKPGGAATSAPSWPPRPHRMATR
jgi:tripartite-type tricarboxylate transporter receptor subunit TctC